MQEKLEKFKFVGLEKIKAKMSSFYLENAMVAPV